MHGGGGGGGGGGGACNDDECTVSTRRRTRLTWYVRIYTADGVSGPLALPVVR